MKRFETARTWAEFDCFDDPPEAISPSGFGWELKSAVIVTRTQDYRIVWYWSRKAPPSKSKLWDWGMIRDDYGGW